MQSREGTPLGSARNSLSQSRRFAAHRWMAVGPSQPHTKPHMAITITSPNRCLRLRVCRGSESDSKYEPIASTFTNLVAMRRILAQSGGLAARSSTTPHASTSMRQGVSHRGQSRDPRRLPVYALAVRGS